MLCVNMRGEVERDSKSLRRFLDRFGDEVRRCAGQQASRRQQVVACSLSCHSSSSGDLKAQPVT